jgi:hypothetical protein
VIVFEPARETLGAGDEVLEEETNDGLAERKVELEDAVAVGNDGALDGREGGVAGRTEGKVSCRFLHSAPIHTHLKSLRVSLILHVRLCPSPRSTVRLFRFRKERLDDQLEDDRRLPPSAQIDLSLPDLREAVLPGSDRCAKDELVRCWRRGVPERR